MTVSAEKAPNEKEAANLDFFKKLEVGAHIGFKYDEEEYSGKFLKVEFIGFDLRWGMYYKRDNSMNVSEVAYLSKIDKPKILS